jgi:hypothetical protein
MTTHSAPQLNRYDRHTFAGSPSGNPHDIVPARFVVDRRDDSIPSEA